MTRTYFLRAFKNFLESFKPRTAKLVGKDQFGTEYYESKDPKHYNRPIRSYITLNKEETEIELPPQWESWLRHTRKLPPTEEEIQQSLQMQNQAVENAKKLEKNYSPQEKPGEAISYPDYSHDPYYKQNSKI